MSLEHLLGPPPANTFGGSGDVTRGTWCSPLWFARLLGPVDLDPCSNERSHIMARIKACGTGPAEDDGLQIAKHVPPWFRVFINCPYAQGVVIQWVRAYMHTDYMFLLRWDPSTEWFEQLLSLNPFVWFPRRKRIEFEPPPGVKQSSNPFPHALYSRTVPSPALLSAGYLFRLSDGMDALQREF